MKVVSNTTPLIGLASIQQFELLKKLFGEIYIPKAVYNEAVVKGYKKSGLKKEISGARWIKTIPVKDKLAVKVLLDELDEGEAETIILAGELEADWVLMDERKGRRKLTELGIQKIGTVGILLKAKEVGLLQKIKPYLYKLRENGFSISQYVIDIMLEKAGEK